MRLIFIFAILFTYKTYANGENIKNVYEKIETEMGAEYMSYFVLTMKDNNEYKCKPYLILKNNKKIHGTISFVEMKRPAINQYKFFVTYASVDGVKWQCIQI
jgi:hypothetical protein